MAEMASSLAKRFFALLESKDYDGLVIPTMREHLDVIAAFESRDPARAATAMAAHINHARNRAMGIGQT